LTLGFSKIQNRSKHFISWVGLRGAVPIVFATYPLLAGADKAQVIFDIVFFISVTSVVIQGTTLPFVARKLHLTIPEKAKQRTLADMELESSIKSNLTEIILPDNCTATGKQIVELGLPKTTEIAIIQRGSKYITPNGATILEKNDRLYVLSENKESLSKFFNCLNISP
jgi:cell volume regulation protein A